MSPARRLAVIHLSLAGLWATAGLAVTLANPESVLWVAVMSLWANVVGHLAAYDAARAEVKQDKTRRRDKNDS